MTITNPLGALRSQSARSMNGPAAMLALALAGTLIVTELLTHSQPRDAVLPTAATLLFVFAAGIALIARWRPMSRRRFTYWDAAGVLTLVGVCVASAVEPEQMVRLVAGTQRP